MINSRTDTFLARLHLSAIQPGSPSMGLAFGRTYIADAHSTKCDPAILGLEECPLTKCKWHKL